MAITVAKHEIQKYILTKLTYAKYVRFRDLKPPRTATNLFSYHLKLLQRGGMIEHDGEGYTLSMLGLAYIDRLNDEGEIAYLQPKMVTMFVIQNSDGGVLLEKRAKQPYIDMWTLPSGKLSVDDESLKDAAAQEIFRRFGIQGSSLRHAGDCYLRVMQSDAQITLTFAHIFTLETDSITASAGQRWVHPRKLHTIDLAPTVSRIIARTFFRDPFFFEEFQYELEP